MNIAIDMWGVFAATIALFVSGALWYAPFAFGGVWMREMKFTKESMKHSHMKPLPASVLGLVLAFLTAYVLAHFSAVWGVVDISDALQLTFWVWLGFTGPIAAHRYLWEGVSGKLVLINLTQLLLSMVLASLALILV